MPMAPFFMKFPEVGARETRSIFAYGHDDLPDGEYGLLELYCDEKDCDCRRVIFNVVEAGKPDKVLATMNYGWESAKFYGKWGRRPGLAGTRKQRAVSGSFKPASPICPCPVAACRGAHLAGRGLH